MLRVLVLGAGKIGRTVAKLLSRTGDYDVSVGDSRRGRPAAPGGQGAAGSAAARRCDGRRGSPSRGGRPRRGPLRAELPPQPRRRGSGPRCRRVVFRSHGGRRDDATDPERRGAGSSGAGVRAPVRPRAGVRVDRGVRPCRRFDRLDAVHMRVGALPPFPTNALKYNLTWSTDGLINEYCNPCDAIVTGRRCEVQSLEGLEHFSLDGRALRGVQHVRRPRHAVRDAGGRVRLPGLQDRPLRRPSRSR